MTLVMIPSIVLAVVAIMSLSIAIHQYRMNHSDHVSAALRVTILAVVNEALEPIKTLLAAHTSLLAQHGDRAIRTEDQIKENSLRIREMSEKMTQTGVKVDMYWTTLEQLAMNAAKGLHQPDPARARVDHLLEAFIEGTLTDGERTELKKILVQIRNFESSGSPEADHQRSITILGYPVQQGEQTFAAILLSTMDVVNPARLAAMGHSLHRREKEANSG